MKKLIHLIALVICGSTALSQSQMENWYLSPWQVYLPAIGNPSVGPIPGAVVAHHAAVNGSYYYDNMLTNGSGLLFYVADGAIYDYNSSLIGNILPSAGEGAEVVIVPFGDNDLTPPHCKLKYNIFSTAKYDAKISLIRTVLDMNSFSIVSTIIDQMPYDIEFGSIAVGKETVDDIRYLYWMAGGGSISAGTGGGQIRKVNIGPDGSVSSGSLFYPPANSNFTNASAIFFARELDLSPDGAWLGWGSFHQNEDPTDTQYFTQYRYHFIHLDPGSGNTNPINTQDYWQFNLVNSPLPGNAAGQNTYNYTHNGFRGVEFWKDPTTGATRMFFGAGNDGVYYTVIPTITAPVYVTGSNSAYGFSQIETSHNGRMYISSPYFSSGIKNVLDFEPSVVAPSVSIFSLNSFIIGNPTLITPFSPNPPSINYTYANPQNPNPQPPTTLFILPDQIDGQDYSVITPSNVPQILTVGVYNFPLNPATTNATATWAYTSACSTCTNPWALLASPQFVQVNYELRIRNNSHLTIEGMIFKFGANARVVIEPGSSLTLNGATFTSDFDHDNCNNPYTWKGIDVVGNPSRSQINLADQGKLIVEGGSTIQYAEWGAKTWDSQFAYTNYAGGIITINNATFSNNKVDIEFNPYQNYRILPGGKQLSTGNTSSVWNCNFETNSFYPFATAPEHVTINGCNGIILSGCTFLSSGSTITNSLQSVGIKTINGGFNVSNTDFTNIWHGIDARHISNNQTIIIDGVNFMDNETGIVLRNINNARVQRCTLYVGGSPFPNASTQLGMSIQNCSSYAIEANEFNPSNPLVTQSIWGIKNLNSGSASNEIYRNTFNNLSIGNLALGINRNNRNPVLHGLQYLCNQNDSNINNDLYIGAGLSDTYLDGIRTNQGTAISPAGNTFSVTTGNPINIDNTSSVALHYYFAPGQAPAIVSSLVFTHQTANDNICPSHLGSAERVVKLTDEEIEIISHNYDSAETAYLNLLYSYNQLMDGGSTNALLNQIQQSWSADAWVLRNQLLSKSPYLSQTILREVALSNVLPQAMLLNVCMANPDATMDEPFLYFLRNEIPNPLPQYMIAMIVASWESQTARATMESTLAHYSQQMANTSNKLLADLYFKNSLPSDSIDLVDTTDYNNNIREWLQRVQTLTAKYDLIENYFAANELTAAQNVLDSIPFNFNLSSDQHAAYNDFVYLYNFRKDILINNVNLSSLNATQIEDLVRFTEQGDNFAKGLARNILCHYYHICTDENNELLGNGDRSFYNTKSNVKVETNTISVAPNPANTYTTFSYQLPMLKEKATLVICDVTGKEIEKIVLTNSEGQQIWDTRNINNGLYYYYVTDGITKIAKGKIAVQK